MAKTKLASPLKWHGGKGPLASRIVALFPPRCKNPNAPAPDDAGWLHYVEPYAGGLSVMLTNDPIGISEVANDISFDLTTFWWALQEQESFDSLRRILEATPFSQIEFKRKSGTSDIAWRAAWFFIRCRQSLAGRMRDFAPISRNRTRKGMNEQVSAWLNAIEGLPEVHARLKRVLILNKSALDVIRLEDGPRTLFYLDPPYLHETRATTIEYGENEMSEADHRELLETLCGLDGRFCLSGYSSLLYHEYAGLQGWSRHDFSVDNKAAGGKTKRRMVESVWCNY
mgnify:FL=1